MKRLNFCLVFALLGMSCQQEVPTISKVDKAFVAHEVVGKEVQLIDVRTPEEYESGHIDDAVNFNIIDNVTFLEQIESLDKNEPVYLYCKMGGRSSRAAQLLKERGFIKIFDYSGGYNDWVTD